MTNNKTDLLPCPWCKSKVELVDSLSPWVRCLNDDCNVNNRKRRFPFTKEQAIQAWNQRRE